MKLELKHLVHYLPYELSLIHKDFRGLDKGITTMRGLHNSFEGIAEGDSPIDIDDDQYPFNLDFWKPILRPLSDLTKEIEHNGERFTPSKVLTKENIGGDMSFPVNGIANYKVENEYERVTVETTIRVLDLLYEWHFDVFGLIEKGLAIDINSLRDD